LADAYQAISDEIHCDLDAHGGHLAIVAHWDGVEERGQLRPSDREPWISLSRNDGMSSIQWFLAPLHDADGKRIEFNEGADSSIEVIQGHRRNMTAAW
jgi:hypothetical protein